MYVNVSVFKASKMHDFHIFVSRTPSARKKDHVKTYFFSYKSDWCEMISKRDE